MEKVTISEDILSAIKDLIAKANISARYPGMAISVFTAETSILKQTFGFRNISKQENVDEMTLFPLASASKSFAALAVLKLVSDGKIELHVPIKTYLPENYRNSALNVTVHQCLSHSSGLADLNGTIEILRHHLMTKNQPHVWEEPAEFLEFVSEIGNYRMFPEGDKFIYNNDLYTLLGLMVEQVTGQYFGDYVAEVILKPLGMDRSTYHGAVFEADGNHVVDYQGIQEGVEPEAITVPHFKINGPGGGCFCCLEDFIKYGQYYLKRNQPEIIFPALFDQMQDYQIITDDKGKEGYGYGWYISNFYGTKMVAHGGNLFVSSSWLGFLPEYDIGIAMLHNSPYADETSSLPRQIFNELLIIPEGIRAAAENIETQNILLKQYLTEIIGGYEHYSGVMSAKVKYTSGKLEIKIKHLDPLPTERHLIFPQKVEENLIQFDIPNSSALTGGEIWFKKDKNSGKWGFLRYNAYFTKK